MEDDVFLQKDTRQHASYKFKRGLMEKLTKKQLIEKIEISIAQLYLR